MLQDVLRGLDLVRSNKNETNKDRTKPDDQWFIHEVHVECSIQSFKDEQVRHLI